MPAPANPSGPAPARPAFRPVGRLYVWMTALVTLTWLAGLAFVVLVMAYGRAFPEVPSTYADLMAAGRWAMLLAAVDVVVLMLGTAALATYCVWAHRAGSNLRAFDVRGLRWSPLMVVLSPLIPFAGVVLPFFAYREVVKASRAGPGRMLAWRSHPAPEWLGAALICSLVGSLLGVMWSVLTLLGRTDGTDVLLGLEYAFFAGVTVLSLVAAHDISTRQERWHQAGAHAHKPARKGLPAAR